MSKRFFWVWKFKGIRQTVTPPSWPVTRPEKPGRTYLTDVAGWPETARQSHAKRFSTRTKARGFPRILVGTTLVRVRKLASYVTSLGKPCCPRPGQGRARACIVAFRTSRTERPSKSETCGCGCHRAAKKMANRAGA